MKIIYTLLIGCFLSLSSNPGSAAVIIPPSSPASSKIVPPSIYKKIATLKLREFQKLAGRKLSIKEKIGFLVLKHKIKRAEGESSKGHTAFVFGILGIGLFVVGLFVPYVLLGSLIAGILAVVTGSVAYKENNNDKKAFTGKLLGWITLGLIALLLILAVVFIASWSWG